MISGLLFARLGLGYGAIQAVALGALEYSESGGLNKYSAIRSFLAGELDSIEYVEVNNAAPQSLPAAPFYCLDFLGGDESLESFGGPGANTYRETGVAQVHIFTSAGAGPSAAESYAESVRAALIGAKIAVLSPAAGWVVVATVDPPEYGDGSRDGRYFRATVAFDYWYDIAA